jgi:radical SAM-linked protein
MGINTVRFKFFKKDELKYLSHLDVLALMERALMRTGMPLLYSGGFHPKPKLSFSNPIPLGVQSLAEYCDIELLEKISAEDFTGLLNRKLPDNLKVIEALSFEKTSENKIPSLMSAIDIVLYEYELFLVKLSSGDPLNQKISKNVVFEGEHLTVESLSFESIKNFFLEDFGKIFGPAEKNEECEADLLKIRSSIYDYEAITAQTASAAVQTKPANESAAAAQTTAQPAAAAGPQENIFFLKIYGYAKILKNNSTTIFKFNVFNEYFEKFLETANIEIRQVQKTGTYIFKGNVLTDPIEILSL